MKNTLQKFSEWYCAQCDGEWEHGSGFLITSLDNPGVSVTIALTGTYLSAARYEEIRDKYESKKEWMICRRNGNSFEGRDAPGRLEDILVEFLSWAEEQTKAANQPPEPTR